MWRRSWNLRSGRPVTLLWFRSERGRLRVGAHAVDRHMLPHRVGAFHVHGRFVGMRIDADDEPPVRLAVIVVERHMPP